MESRTSCHALALFVQDNWDDEEEEEKKLEVKTTGT